jgi:Kef-type K+ transport system membrane component KefB
MFVIGMELDLNILKQKAGTAIVISHASIVIPYGLGVSLSYFLYKTYAPVNIPFYAFSLFMGIAMSITAFPVLARIIRERGLSNTRLGTIAITCAAADDITAWCLLAAVIAVVKAGSIGASLYILLYALFYVGVMFFVVKPLLKKILLRKDGNKMSAQSALAVVFVVLLLSAYCSEVIGIHALFGAFVAGVIMPMDWDFSNNLIHKIEDVALVLLLPLFFVFTGLRTEIGLLNDASLWGTCLVIIAVAVTGKFGGSALAAKWMGESWKDSLSIGALMNTRGLVELVVLNVGYDLGILTPQVFTMMVLMALVTTLMTSPALRLVDRLIS